MSEEQNKPDAPPEETGEPKRQSRRFLAVYIIGLFSIALVLILLSYLTQVRADRQLEAMQNKVLEQTSAAQGATQKMEILQQTIAEQTKRLEETRVPDTIFETVGAQRMTADVQGLSDDQALDLLLERYIALDTLQQVRRLLEKEQYTEAGALLDKMVENYGEARLTTPLGDDSVLVGANSEEYSRYRETVDTQAAQADATENE